MNQSYQKLKVHIDKAMALKAAMMLFEWDNETLAPKDAGPLTARIVGTLSGEYFQAVTGDQVKELIGSCKEEGGLTQVESAVIRELEDELEQLECVPQSEYEAFARLTAEATRVWADAKNAGDFDAFAPTLEKVIGYQKKFASYRAKKGQKLYDVMLDTYEKGFDMEHLDQFFDALREELVPFIRQVTDSRVQIRDDFLTGGYGEEDQEKLGRMMAEYMGFDFDRGVMAVSAHPFTTNIHNQDVRITTHYSDNMSSSLFSVIHEAGHAVYELGIRDDLTLTPVGQGASMGMHEAQSRFFENIIGRSRAFWIPLYDTLQSMFPRQLTEIGLDQFVKAINKVRPGLIRTEADELTYSLHVLIRYEIEKLLIEEDLDVKELPKVWADKYQEYLGVGPESDSQGVLQDIHWAQGSFGYFPSYALGSAFGAQIYRHMKEEMDVEELLESGHVDRIREYLREHIHQYGKLKTSRQILKDVTGEDFSPDAYIAYLKEKYGAIYGIEP